MHNYSDSEGFRDGKPPNVSESFDTNSSVKAE